MIIYDTETTGLIGHLSAPLVTQPEIIEIGAVRLHDETLEETARMSVLVRPSRRPIPDKITEITGIKDADLDGKPSFALVLPEMMNFFLGERTSVCHNAPFDMGMLLLELRRLDRVTKFPWPMNQLCTVELSMDLKGRRMRQEELYEHYMGKPAGQTHRALDDVRQLAEIVRHMRTEGRI